MYGERLSALDATFLDVETRVSPMAIGAVCVFANGTMVSNDGSFDTARLRAHIAHAIAQLPRYRQRLAITPLIGQPVWIDDDRFNLDFHVHYTRLPTPGDDRQLRRLAARLFSQQLDRDHPLWELYCVEGLTEQRFAIIAKVHHCMADGIGGVGLLTALLQSTASALRPLAPPVWQPRDVPRGRDLLRAEIVHRNKRAWDFLRAVAPVCRRTTSNTADVANVDCSKLSNPINSKSPVRAVANGMYEILRTGLQRRSQTPLTPTSIGGARRFDTAQFSLDDVRSIAHSLGGTVNDVVLTLVAGVLRSFLMQRGFDSANFGALRAMIPVNLRAHGGNGFGNQLAMLLTELPIHQADPLVRHQLIRVATERLKNQSDQIAASAFFTAVADAAATSLLTKVFQVAVRLRAFDVVVTNVRGPRESMFLGDAELIAMYPMVPLYERQAIGVAIFSYAGVLYVGLSAARDLVPDLHNVALEFQREMSDLRTAAVIAATP